MVQCIISYLQGRNRRQYERIQAFTVSCPPVTLLSIHTNHCGLPQHLNIFVNTSLAVETKISSPIIKLHVFVIKLYSQWLSSLFLKRGNPKTSPRHFYTDVNWCCAVDGFTCRIFKFTLNAKVNPKYCCEYTWYLLSTTVHHADLVVQIHFVQVVWSSTSSS